MKSGSRLLKVLSLFSPERPIITIEEAAKRLSISESMMYRYFSILADAGLVEPVRGAGYVLGPAIIAYDWQIRRSDPMLQKAKPTVQWLLSNSSVSGAVLLCRLYRDLVMCVYQAFDPSFAGGIGYERGRPMPMFRGAPSKVILANLPLQAARDLYEAHGAEIRQAGLGNNFGAFSAQLHEIRRAGYAVSHGEVDPGVVGVAAPIIVSNRVVGSICVAGPEKELANSVIARVATLTIAAASEISQSLSESTATLGRSGRRARGTNVDQPARSRASATRELPKKRRRS